MKCQKKHTACLPLFQQPLQNYENQLICRQRYSYKNSKTGEATIKEYSFAIHRNLYPFAILMRVYDQRVWFAAQTQNLRKALLNKLIHREKPAVFAFPVAGYHESKELESKYKKKRLCLIDKVRVRFTFIHGGGWGTRTPDPLLVRQTLSQLS